LYLRHLRISSFRNHGKSEYTFVPGINLLCGLNGVGKTNLLDAIFLLSTGRSFFYATDAQMIKKGENYYRVEGTFDEKDSSWTIAVGCEAQKRKKIWWNSTSVRRSSLLGKSPVVMITPFDISLLLEGSEARRKFLDECLSVVDSAYLNAISKYQRLLDQRNALLKRWLKYGESDLALLNGFDEQMQPHAQLIVEKRRAFVTELSEILQSIYAELSDDQEGAHLEYHSDLIKKDWFTLQKECVQKDLVLGRSNAGVHKDDLHFTIGGFPVKKYASQGQLKSLLFATKLAQYQWLHRKKDIKPILLLDDISEKIDAGRGGRLVSYISRGDFGQIFITDTDHKRISEMLSSIKAEKKIFKFENSE
jgi:DNA replication and repair protein RecF